MQNDAKNLQEHPPELAQELDLTPRGDVYPSPADWRDCVVYQLLFDRFDDGDEDRPMFDPAGDLPQGDVDPEVGGTWQGGTIKGATRRLDYLKGLGVGAIWCSPPFQQRHGDRGQHDYHGYAIQDFLRVDKRLGTMEDFVELVREAHDRGIRVIMDVVIDHVADLWGYRGEVSYDGRRHEIGGWHDGGSPGDFDRAKGEGLWPAELQGEEAFGRWGPVGDVGSASGAEAKDGDFMTLKGLDLGNDRVLSAVIQVMRWWVAVADVDGFRIDALRHIRHAHARDFVHALREYAMSIGKHNFMLVGEVAGGDEEMARYVGSNVELGHDPEADDPDGTGCYPYLTAVLDFPWHRQWDAILRNERPSCDAAGRLDWMKSRYRHAGEAGRYYMTFLENHDQGDADHRRVFSGTQDDNPDQDRPGRDVRMANLSATVLLTSLGIPTIYYGHEQAFDGGGDRDTYVRESMFGGTFGPFGTGDRGNEAGHFFDESHPTYGHISRLSALRAEEPALRYGHEYMRLCGEEPGEPFVFARVLAGREVVVACNPALEEREFFALVDGDLNPPGSELEDALTGDRHTVADDGCINLTLPARGSAVLRRPVS